MHALLVEEITQLKWPIFITEKMFIMKNTRFNDLIILGTERGSWNYVWLLGVRYVFACLIHQSEYTFIYEA